MRHQYACCCLLSGPWTAICVAFVLPDLIFRFRGSWSWSPPRQRATGWSDWWWHIDRSAEAWIKTNGIGLYPCFINTEKTWHYVIAAVPVVISDFHHSSWCCCWDFFFCTFSCLRLNGLIQGAHWVIFSMFRTKLPKAEISCSDWFVCLECKTNIWNLCYQMVNRGVCRWW